jgi:hypothetical protein
LRRIVERCPTLRQVSTSSLDDASNNKDLRLQTQANAPFAFKSVSGAVTNRGTGPPPQKKAAPGALISPDAAADIERPWQSIRAKDSPSAAARQACDALLREDIGAALRFTIDNAALALRYLESGDDPAVQYLAHRSRAFATFAAECALELRRMAA